MCACVCVTGTWIFDVSGYARKREAKRERERDETRRDKTRQDETQTSGKEENHGSFCFVQDSADFVWNNHSGTKAVQTLTF